MSYNKVQHVKWYYRFIKEIAVLLNVFSDVAEFFEKVHKILAKGLEVFGKVVPPVAFIVAAVGHISVIAQLADKQKKPEDYQVLGARVFSGIAMLALAITSLVLVQYTLPLLAATMLIDTGLVLFKAYRLRRHIKRLEKQLSDLQDSPQRAQVEAEIKQLQNVMAQHKQKINNKAVELSYTGVVAALVIVGLAIPPVAPIMSAIVAVSSVAFTVYRYRKPIQNFIARVGRQFRRLGGLLTGSSRNLQSDDAEEAEDEGEAINEVSADVVDDSIQPVAQVQQQPEPAVVNDAVVKQTVDSAQQASHFLQDQEHLLESMSAATPHPQNFEQAHQADHTISDAASLHSQQEILNRSAHQQAPAMNVSVDMSVDGYDSGFDEMHEQGEGEGGASVSEHEHKDSEDEGGGSTESETASDYESEGEGGSGEVDNSETHITLK